MVVPERSIQEVAVSHKERVRDKFKPSILNSVNFKPEEAADKLFKAVKEQDTLIGPQLIPYALQWTLKHISKA